MIRDEYREKLERRQTRLVLLWLAFVLSNFLYLFTVNFLLTHGLDARPPYFSHTVRAGLWIMAAASIWALHGFWRKRFLKIEAILSFHSKSAIPVNLRDHASAMEEQAAQAVNLYFTFKRAAFAFAAAVAIFGFFLAFFGHYVVDQYLLSIVSFVLLLYEFPSKLFLQQLIETVEIRGNQQPIAQKP